MTAWSTSEPEAGAPHVDGDWTVFVDRDGVINRRVVGAYLRSTEQLELLPGAIDALARLSQAAAHVIVVTNQAGIGKGLLTVADFERVNAVIVDAVVASGGHLDAVLYCPHVPADGCRCRKPGPGLAEQADERFGDIVHARSVMIGDSACDIRFGADLGMATVLVTGTGGDHDGAPEPDLRAEDLAGAADLLLASAVR